MKEGPNDTVKDNSIDRSLAKHEVLLGLGLRAILVLDRNNDFIFDVMPILFAIMADPDTGEKFENSIELFITFIFPFVIGNISKPHIEKTRE